MGYARRNFLVPIPSFENFEGLNAYLEVQCRKRLDAPLRGHDETIGERLERDLVALLPLPVIAYDASDKHATRVSSLSLVRYRTNDYSVPVAYGHRDVLVRGYVHQVVISCGPEVIARHLGPMREMTSSSTLSTTSHYWNRRRGLLTRRHHWLGGSCPKSSPYCGGCWSPGWASEESASSSRC